MVRKIKHPEYPIAGRPPKDVEEKVGIPLRALVTLPLKEAVDEIQSNMNINQAEFLRLAMYHYLNKLGALSDGLRNDPTFDSLREKGLL